ncbi:MAG: MerR family transcriptional regulator [Paracoccus sp. (in: a-proteobacteria)]
MQKGDDAFRSIGEVASLIGVAPHVLRYWETQFPQLKPMKRPDGRRYYRPDDVRLAAGLCEVLRDDGLTIRGARKLIAADRGELVRARGAERLALADAGAAVTTAASPPAVRRAASRRPADRAQQPVLPLFDTPAAPAPPLASAPVSAGAWLGCLIALRRSLGRLTPQDPRWPAACEAALRLGQRITGHP